MKLPASDTGKPVQIRLSEYSLSLTGDILGEGNISIDGVKQAAKHIIDGNVLIDEYLLSADYDGDGVVKMNDVMKMLSVIK